MGFTSYTQAGSYQSKAATGVNLTASNDTGTISAGTNWSATQDGQAFIVIRGGTNICVRCAKSVSTTTLTYYRLYDDNGTEIPTDIQIGDTITMCEQPELVGAGSLLSAVATMTSGGTARTHRSYSLGANTISVTGYFQLPDLHALVSTSTNTFSITGVFVYGEYRTNAQKTRFSLANFSYNGGAGALSQGGRLDWFGGVMAGDPGITDSAGKTTIIYSKNCISRVTVATPSVNNQLRISGSCTTYGYTATQSQVVQIAAINLNGYQPNQQDSALTYSSSSPANTWITTTNPILKAGNVVDVAFWASIWARIVNNASGSDVIVGGNSAGASSTNKGLHEYRQNVTTNITNVAGAGVTGRIFCRDTNNGSRLAANQVGTNPSYTADRTYESAVSSGSATFTTDGGVLVAAAYQNVPGASVTRFQNITWDRRGLDNSSTDRFKFGLAAYGYLPATTTVVLKGNLGTTVPYTMLTDSGVTASLSTALTYTDRFSIDGSGNITITNNATLDQLYDYAQAWLQQSGANMELATLGNQLISASSTSISTTKNITINTGITLSTGSKFNNLITTGTVTYNGTGKATVTVTDVSGSTTIFTLSNLTSGSSISLLNNSGTRFEYVASSGTSQVFYLPAGSTGTWTYNIALYGKQDVQSSIVVTGGGYKSALVSQSTDTGITQANVATVSAYTDLGTPEKVYDYAAYWKTTTNGIDITRLATKSGSQCLLDSLNITQDATAAPIWTYTTGALTFKAVSMDTGSIMTSIGTTGTWTYLNSATYTIPITSSAGTTAVLNLAGLSSHIVRVIDNSSVEQDYQTSVTGTYTLKIAAGATGTWSWKTTKYGQLQATGTFTMLPGGVFSFTPAQITDTAITQSNLATVLAYTTLETADKVYDYCQAYLTTTSGKTITQFATKNGSAVDFGSLNLIVDDTAVSVFTLSSPNLTIKATTEISGVTFQGFITLGTISAVNGARIDTWYTSSAGRSVLIRASSIVAGSQAMIFNVTDNTEIDNSVVPAGGIYYRLLWTIDKTFRIDIAKAGYDTLSLTGLLSDTGLTFLSAQTVDSVYVSNGIDGSTVTEFSTDYPNIQVDINDPDNTTTLARLYAWYKYNEATADGLRYYFNGLIAIDSVNYEIDGSIIDLALDNKKATLLTVMGGLIIKIGGTGLVASTTTGSIYFDSGKAYIANSEVIVTNLSGIKKNTDLIPGLL